MTDVHNLYPVTLFHGSPSLFKQFTLSAAGSATGVKFGYGVYLTESEASAVHYSQPRNMPLTPQHYLYTVEVPALTDDNHLVSALPVEQSIIERVETKLGITVPDDVRKQGKEFRKWIGCMLTGGKKAGLEEEKAAAEFLDSIGVFCNVWSQAQTKPDGLKNMAVFNPGKVHIVRIEQIGITLKNGKHLLVEGSKKEIR